MLRASSAACAWAELAPSVGIRLTNWDAARLAQMVSGSTKVVLQK